MFNAQSAMTVYQWEHISSECYSWYNYSMLQWFLLNFFNFFYISSFLSVFLFASFFVCCLSSCTRRRPFLSKALVHCCFLVCRRIGEYRSPDLFCFVSLTNSCTLRASLSGTFLQTLPDLVTQLKGYSLSPRICPATRSAPSERFGY